MSKNKKEKLKNGVVKYENEWVPTIISDDVSIARCKMDENWRITTGGELQS